MSDANDGDTDTRFLKDLKGQETAAPASTVASTEASRDATNAISNDVDMTDAGETTKDEHAENMKKEDLAEKIDKAGALEEEAAASASASAVAIKSEAESAPAAAAAAIPTVPTVADVANNNAQEEITTKTEAPVLTVADASIPHTANNNAQVGEVGTQTAAPVPPEADVDIEPITNNIAQAGEVVTETIANVATVEDKTAAPSTNSNAQGGEVVTEETAAAVPTVADTPVEQIANSNAQVGGVANEAPIATATAGEGGGGGGDDDQVVMNNEPSEGVSTVQTAESLEDTTITDAKEAGTAAKESEVPVRETKKRIRRVGRTPTRKIAKLDETALATPSMDVDASDNISDTMAAAGAADAATAAIGAAPNATGAAVATSLAIAPPNQGVLSKHDEKWHSMFQKLLEFRERNKHTLVPQCYGDDPRLGRWVHYQRVEYWIFQQKGSAKITEERIARLNTIGFEWDPQKAQWEKMFAKLKQFKKEFSHCRVPKGYDKDWELANWVRNQRLEQANLSKEGKKSRMTPERFKLLDDLGFKWSSPTPARARRTSKPVTGKKPMVSSSIGEQKKEPKSEESPAVTLSVNEQKAAEGTVAAIKGEVAMAANSNVIDASAPVAAPMHAIDGTPTTFIDTAAPVETAPNVVDVANPAATVTNIVDTTMPMATATDTVGATASMTAARADQDVEDPMKPSAQDPASIEATSIEI